MAKIKCKCGAILRDDDPHDSLFILTSEDFDVETPAVDLFGKAALVIRCKTCGRLWIYWDEHGEPSEYVEFRGA